MSVDRRHRDTHRHRTRAALRLPSRVSVLVAVAAWLVGCGEPQLPQPPVAGEEIPRLTVEVGSTESVDLAGHFSDPDGDVLTYTARSSDSTVATVSLSGAILQVTGVAGGSTAVAVTATDPDALTANQTFTVTVPNRAPVAGEPIDDIEVVAGDTAQVGVSANFSDPDGDALTYTATTSDDEVATASAVGSVVAVRGVSPGTADVTVTATDPGGLFATQTFAVTVVRSVDRGALEILYDELDGDNWTDNTNWKTGRPLGEWFGVSTRAGWVVALDLPDNSLTGEIPAELGSLRSLEELHLWDNALTGEIPPELGDLPDLRILYLDGNSLTGEVPPELGDLSSLERLHLGVNSLTGEIPAQFLDLSALVLFYWYDNDGLCAPDTTEFDDWLDGMDWNGPRCD